MTITWSGCFSEQEDEMPYSQIRGANLYYEEHGAGQETIVFSHGLLFSGRMFHDQIAALNNQYRCIQ